ncbi:VOC family protein [Oerskovia sp. M15]
MTGRPGCQVSVAAGKVERGRPAPGGAGKAVMSSPTQPRTYPHGVPCWVDTEQPDVDAATAFYGALFGWTFTDKMPPDAPGRYVVASLDGQDVAAIASPPDGADATPEWITYVAVDDVGVTARAVEAGGGTLVSGPETVGPPGRMASVKDPQGARFRLWQAARASVPSAPTSRGLELQRPPHSRPRPCARLLRTAARLGSGPRARAGMFRVAGTATTSRTRSTPDLRAPGVRAAGVCRRRRGRRGRRRARAVGRDVHGRRPGRERG